MSDMVKAEGLHLTCTHTYIHKHRCTHTTTCTHICTRSHTCTCIQNYIFLSRWDCCGFYTMWFFFLSSLFSFSADCCAASFSWCPSSCQRMSPNCVTNNLPADNNFPAFTSYLSGHIRRPASFIKTSKAFLEVVGWTALQWSANLKYFPNPTASCTLTPKGIDWNVPDKLGAIYYNSLVSQHTVLEGETHRQTGVVHFSIHGKPYQLSSHHSQKHSPLMEHWYSHTNLHRH